MAHVKTSRQRVLEYIQTQKVVTVADISHALRMTPANARHHLAILEEEGLVVVMGERPAVGRGRPAQMYALSPQVQGDNLGGLAGALLDEYLSGSLEAGKELAMRRLGARLAGEAAPAGKRVHPTLRLAKTVQRLNELRYQAHWEAHAGGPEILLNACPYAAILEAHPELCQMDAALLETMTGEKVAQVARRAQDKRGARFCRFRLVS